MKRRKTILCTILVLLAVSLAGLFWWQRDNLKAIHAATQHTSAELEEKLEENQQMIEEAVRSASEVTVREVTEEERQALRDGSMTQEQLMERLTGSGGACKSISYLTATKNRFTRFGKYRIQPIINLLFTHFFNQTIWMLRNKKCILYSISFLKSSP